MNNNNLFQNAFDAIDDEFIAEAKSPAIRIAARRKKIMISTIAACVAAVLVAIPSVKIISDLNDNKFTTSDDIEIITEYETVYENASSEQSSSNDIKDHPQNSNSLPANSNSLTIGTTGSSTIDDSASGYKEIIVTTEDLFMTNMSTNGSTTTYTKVYVPNAEYLYINQIPTDKYVTIYEEYYEKNLDPNEAKAFADKHFPKMAAALKIGLPTYEIESGYTDQINIVTNSLISSRQKNNLNQVGFYPSGSIILNGKPVTVNQTQSDQEIINSLSEIKQILFDTFDISFDSAKVYRNYDDDSNYGVKSLNVYFYNSDAHPLNNLWGIGVPKSDCITISFDNFENFEGDIVSNADLYNVFSIDFWSYRTDNHSPLNTVTQKELLPLQKAEEYLQKGYVLAMGGCTQCQAEQTPVDFTNYDYVSFEYVGGSEIGDLMLPYYAFYKNIGTAENGNMVFAKTYVPAVEVEGYEEYFINKHDNHNTRSDSDNDYVLEDSGE